MKQILLLTLLTALSLGLFASALVTSGNSINVQTNRDPVCPYNLMAQVIDINDVLLVWENPVFVNQPMGFRVFRNNIMVRQISGSNVTDCTIENVCAGCCQFYVTACFDNGSQTAPSNIAEVTIIETANQDAAASTPAISMTVFPNPSRSTVNIALSGTKQYDKADLAIYNIKGQLVRQYSMKGSKNWQWDGKDKLGNNVTNGIYYLKATTNNGNLMHKLIITR